MLWRALACVVFNTNGTASGLKKTKKQPFLKTQCATMRWCCGELCVGLWRAALHCVGVRFLTAARTHV